MLKCYVGKRASAWSNMPVTGFAKYLGCMIGPKAQPHVWKDAIMGFVDAASKICDADLTPSMAIKAYNTFSFSKLSYHLQILDPCNELFVHQRRIAHNLLKVPTSTLRDVDL
eukprot:150545-Karenia_brevis.AAC.1